MSYIERTWYPTLKHKFGKGRNYNGKFFDSNFEKEYAIYLDTLVDEGDLKEWQYHPNYRLYVNEKFICEYRPDFKLTLPDGSVEIHETKGAVFMGKKEFIITWNLFHALFDELEPRGELHLIKQPSRNWYLKNKIFNS